MSMSGKSTRRSQGANLLASEKCMAMCCKFPHAYISLDRDESGEAKHQLRVFRAFFGICCPRFVSARLHMVVVLQAVIRLLSCSSRCRDFCLFRNVNFRERSRELDLASLRNTSSLSRPKNAR